MPANSRWDLIRALKGEIKFITNIDSYVCKGVARQRHVLAALLPGKRPDALCTGAWVGFGAGMDGSGKSCSHGVSNT